MSLKQVALLTFLSLLGACNVAMSDQPLFGDAQRSSTLLLEDGIWTLDKPECAADLAKPRKDWPACVDWIIVSRNKALLGSDSKPGDGPEDILIVDGKPPLLQAKVTTSGSPPAWGYLVFHPQAVSKAGRVMRSRSGQSLAASRRPEAGQARRSIPILGSTKSAGRHPSMHCARRQARSAPPTPKP